MLIISLVLNCCDNACLSLVDDDSVNFYSNDDLLERESCTVQL